MTRRDRLRLLMPKSPGPLPLRGASVFVNTGSVAIAIFGCLEVLLTEDADLGRAESEEHHGKERRQRGGVTEGEVREGLLVHVGHQRLRRVVRTTFGYLEDLRENLRGADYEEHRDESHGPTY